MTQTSTTPAPLVADRIATLAEVNAWNTAQARAAVADVRTALVELRTLEIAEAEAATTPDTELIQALYAQRFSRIVEALEAGVTPAALSAITGNGGF